MQLACQAAIITIATTALMLQVNSPRSSHPASRTGSGIPSDEEDAPPTRPPHITSIYEQAKARQQQVQQAQARDADPPVSNAAAQVRCCSSRSSTHPCEEYQASHVARHA